MISHDTEFQITLPSNVNDDLCPNNKASRYITRLCKDLQLCGDWEVAIIDVQHPTNISNVPSDVVIGFMVQLGTAVNVDSTNDKYAPFPPFIKEMEGIILLTVDKNQRASWQLRCCFLIRTRFNSVEDLCEHICNVYKTVYSGCTRQDGKAFPLLQYQYDQRRKMVEFTLYGAQKFELASSSDEIFTLLGLPAIESDSMLAYRCVQPVRSTKAPSLRVTRSMYIYTDIAKYQMIGNTQAPLLGVLPITDEGYYACNPAYYIPLNKAVISTIEIFVYDDRGEEIMFIEGSKIIVRLHFRRMRNSLM